MAVTIATAAMLARASPRKPRVWILVRSSTVAILLVAYRSKARRRSSRFIPSPLSTTSHNVLPPLRITTIISSAPASMLFSTNSLTIEAGRWTTSPAAILFVRFSDSIFIFDINSEIHSFCFSNLTNSFNFSVLDAYL